MGKKQLVWLKVIATLFPASIIVLLAFVIIELYLSHILSFKLLLIAVGGISLIGTFIFSRFIFKIVEKSQAELLQRNLELQTMNSVAQSLVGMPQDQVKILDIALIKVLEVTNIDAGTICLLDEEQKELVHLVFKGLPDEIIGPLRRVKLSQDKIGNKVVTSGEPVVIYDLTLDPEMKEKAERYGFRSVVSLPLKYKGRVLGVMALASHNSYLVKPSELRFLLGIGAELSMAIANARLYVQVQKLAVESERGRIAREMHDGLAQLLGYINTKVLAARKFISQGDISQADKHLEQMEEAAREAYEDVREGVLGLKTTTSSAGLIPALKEYIQKFSELSGIETHLLSNLNDSVRCLEPISEVQIIRVVQESLTNIRKHASASTAWLKFIQEDGLLRIIIEDNGCGFEPGYLPREGQPRFGLQTMKERVESIGGMFTLQSRSGEGTKVIMDIPKEKIGL